MTDTNSSHIPSGADPKLLEFLVCPITKETLVYQRDTDELISRGARLAYPIRDGIPLCCRKRRGHWMTTR